MSKYIKQLSTAVTPFYKQYEVASVTFTEGSNYPSAEVKFLDGVTIVVLGIPKTSTTPIKQISQNILKWARQGKGMGNSTVAYKGGK